MALPIRAADILLECNDPRKLVTHCYARKNNENEYYKSRFDAACHDFESLHEGEYETADEVEVHGSHFACNARYFIGGKPVMICIGNDVDEKVLRRLDALMIACNTKGAYVYANSKLTHVHAQQSRIDALSSAAMAIYDEFKYYSSGDQLTRLLSGVEIDDPWYADLAAEYDALRQQKSEVEARMKEIQGRLAALMTNNSRVVVGDYTIATKATGGSPDYKLFLVQNNLDPNMAPKRKQGTTITITKKLDSKK